MKTIFLMIFLSTFIFANGSFGNNYQGQIDMHGGKEDSLTKGKKFGGAIQIIDNLLGDDKKKNTSDKKIIKIDEIKIDKIEPAQN